MQQLDFKEPAAYARLTIEERQAIVEAKFRGGDIRYALILAHLTALSRYSPGAGHALDSLRALGANQGQEAIELCLFDYAAGLLPATSGIKKWAARRRPW